MSSYKGYFGKNIEHLNEFFHGLPPNFVLSTISPILNHYQMLYSSPTFMHQLDHIIEVNLHKEDFSIEFLCQQLTISYTHVYRKIKAQTGLSPSRYVCKKRLQQAYFLLEHSELTMGEIAFRVGFNTQAYFSKCFSNEYGHPPLRYRNFVLMQGKQY